MDEETITKEGLGGSEVVFTEGKKMGVRQPHKSRKLVMAILAGVAVLLALAAGIGIYNTPANRLSRHLELANKYLLETKYEQAIVEFDKAITIDPMSVEAYLGKAEAYVGLDDIDMAIETLETGFEKSQENTDIKQKLVDLYLAVTEEKDQNAKYEEKLKIYDRLLELATDDERVIDGLCECLKAYIDVLLEQEKYDEIRALAEKYRSVAVYVDFDAILARIRQIEESRALVRNILTRIALYCSEERYDNVFKLMQSEEYGEFLAKIGELSNDYVSETEYGKIGVYKVEAEMYGNYMIYYGDFEEDKRQGSGVWLGYYDNNNYMARGAWEGDVPQGEFTVREWSSILAQDIVYRVISGNADNGLWNGEVLWKFERESGVTQSFSVSFENGKWVILGQDDDGAWIVCEKGTGPDTEGGLAIYNENLDMINGIAGFAPNR